MSSIILHYHSLLDHLPCTRSKGHWASAISMDVPYKEVPNDILSTHFLFQFLIFRLLKLNC